MTKKLIATFMIKDADKMTPQGRKEIADWLRHQARSLTKSGDEYAKTFTAKYFTAPRGQEFKQVK